tara:strand:+ start:402 stop:1688 length:1287 start_codon:yes stop_codon:yes gene_type:complete
MRFYKNIEACRICGSKNLIEVIHIEDQYLSPTFVQTNVNNPLADIRVPQTLVLCDKSDNNDGCGLLQLKETVDPDLLYREYFYRSAVSDTMRRDLHDVVDEVLNNTQVTVQDNDVVLDTGANDCTMLSYFPETLTRIGVEPANNIDWGHVPDSISIVNDYFTYDAIKETLGDKKIKILTSCAMFYDLDEPNNFVADVKKSLDPQGVWCIQLSYLPSMLKNINFYDICNEHLEYYSLQTLHNLMERHGLSIFDATTNHVNGGSARVFITHSERELEETERLQALYKMEASLDLNNEQTYFNFKAKIDELKNKIKSTMLSEIQQGKLVLGLGASTKGNMLLQLFDIGKETIPYISERNPEKVGLKTLGTDIELISEERARELNPSCMLVLPWYFKDEIVKREKEYLENGGKLLFPMPYPHIVHKDGETKL